MSAKSIFKIFEEVAGRFREYLLKNVTMTVSEKETIAYLHDVPGAMIYDFVEQKIAPKARRHVKTRDDMKDKSKFTVSQTREALADFLPPKTLLRVARASSEVRTKILDYLSWFVTAVGDADDE